VRNDHGDGRVLERDTRDRERISEPEIEPAWQIELAPDSNRQDAAVNEDRPSRGGRIVEHVADRPGVEGIPVHRRKQADALKRVRRQAARADIGRVWRRGVVHEKADEARWVPCDRRRNRRFVAGSAGDEHGTADAVSIQLLHPAVRERLHGARVVPAHTGGDR